jgi:hypothetical protein
MKAAGRSGAAFFALVVLLLLAHGLSVRAPFQFDDVHQIVDNRAIRDPASLPRFFVDGRLGSGTGHGFYYRPILFVTFVLDGLIGSGSAVPYRITSLAILLAFGLLAGRFAEALLARIFPGTPADKLASARWLTSALVLVHPLLNESVLLASGRSSLLMATFGIASLTAVARADSSRRRTVEIVVFAALAVLTKETGVILALLAPLVSLVCATERPILRRAFRAWPVWLVVVAYLALYTVVKETSVDPGPATLASLRHENPLVDRAGQGWLALMGFVRLLVLPIGTSLVHEIEFPSSFLRWLAWLLWPAALVAGALLLRSRGWRSLVGFSSLWFMLALLPILMVGLNTPQAEHRVVLALLAPLAAAGWAIASIEHHRARIIVGAVTLGTLALAAMIQTMPWRSSIDLWEHETRLNPHSARAWSFLTTAYRVAGALPKARNAAAKALDLVPVHPIYLTQAARVELEAGDLVRAGEYTGRALSVENNYTPLHVVETERLALLGNLSAALQHARRATELSPELSAAWNALGNVQLMMGDRRAADAYRRAIELDPSNRQAVYNLGIVKSRWPE